MTPDDDSIINNKKNKSKVLCKMLKEMLSGDHVLWITIMESTSDVTPAPIYSCQGYFI